MGKIYKAFIKTTRGIKLYAITDNKKFMEDFKSLRKDKLFKYRTVEVDDEELIEILNQNRGEVLEINRFMTSEVHNNKIRIKDIDLITPYNEYMVVHDNVENAVDVFGFEDFWTSEYNYPLSVYKESIVDALNDICYIGIYNMYAEMDETPQQYSYKSNDFVSSYDELGVFLKLFRETLK